MIILRLVLVAVLLLIIGYRDLSLIARFGKIWTADHQVPNSGDVGAESNHSSSAFGASSEELVFFTEDIGIGPAWGCDAISVASLSQRGILHLGRKRPSPGRMAANSDLSLILATPTKFDVSGDDGSAFNNLYALFRSSNSPDGWDDTYLKGEQHVQSPGGIAFTPDGSYLLVATLIIRDWCLGVQPSGQLPYSVSKYRVDQIDLANHRLGPEVGRIELVAPVAEILPARGGEIAHLVTVPQFRSSDRSPAVITIDVETMREVAPRVQMALTGSPQESCKSGWIPMSVTHATLSPDERFLVTNRWVEGGLNVADLVTRQSWTLDLDVSPRNFTGGVAFNHGWENHGLLAVHNVNRVVIYNWSDGRSVTELARVAVPPPVVLASDGRHVDGNGGFQSGPTTSLAWSGSGGAVVAAVNTRGFPEFRSWHVTDGGRRLDPGHDYEVCNYPENFQNDILTGNGILPTRTPTSSSTPTTTDLPTLTRTPTPSPTPTATASPTLTASATPSTPPTATSTATPTPSPAPAYIPLALRERCLPDQRRIDVVLVIDASSSMQDPTSTGRPKIAAALDAARTFLDQLQPDRGDQAAVVAFNADAALLQPLTTDRAALASALTRIQIAPQTCLVCGVEAADAELAGPRHRLDHAATMIVLTDGRSNPRPAGEAVERAAAAKARGVVVFTIGLGDDLDAEALAAMASRPDFAYRAPDAEDLADIYRAIAVAIPCPAGAFWGGR